MQWPSGSWIQQAARKNANNTEQSGVATKTPFGWRLCKQRLTVSVHTAGSRVDGKVFTSVGKSFSFRDASGNQSRPVTKSSVVELNIRTAALVRDLSFRMGKCVLDTKSHIACTRLKRR